jgi:hypothetical protein
VPDIRGLALEHLGQQILGDGPLAARECGDEPLGLGVALQGDCRQTKACGPALGPLLQQRDIRLSQLDAGTLDQLLGFVSAERQIGGPDLSEPI